MIYRSWPWKGMRINPILRYDTNNSSLFFPRYFHIALALLFSIGYFLLHMHFMQLYLDWDQFAYSGNVKIALIDGNIPLFNAHHLHFELGGKLFHDFMSGFFGKYGFTDLAFNLRLRSLTAATIGIFFSILFLNNATKKISLSLLGGLLLGCLHGYFHYATKIDTGVFPAAVFFPMLWIFERISSAGKNLLPYSLLGGAMLFLGVMMHQTNAFACIVMSLCILIPGKLLNGIPVFNIFSIVDYVRTPLIDTRLRHRYSAWALYTFTGVFLVIAAYFWVGQSHYNLTLDKNMHRESKGLWSTYTFQQWLFSYATTDMWGHGIRDFNPKAPFRGFSDAMLSQDTGWQKFNRNYEFKYKIDALPDSGNFAENLLAWLTISVAGFSLLFFPMLVRKYGRVFLCLFFCTIVYCIFFTYWEPFYFEFWLIPALLVSTLWILILNFVSGKINRFIPGLGSIVLYGLMSFVAFVFITHNLRNYIIPYSRDRHMQGISYAISPERYEWMFSPSVYKNPQHPHEKLPESNGK
jgi:hypothetical protein